MRLRILIFLLSCCFIGDTVATESGDAFTIYLVRHAEKQLDGGKDPVLTRDGKQRAVRLAAWFQDKNIKGIWSSNYHRTRDTAMPLAKESGLVLLIYDPSQLTSLAERLMRKQKNVVVVGHSNTTPDLARLLCHCEIDDMDESEYNRIIAVTVLGAETQVQTIWQTPLPTP